MDYNNNNGKTQSWTDPITGEVYPSGNPHVSIQKSTAARPNVQVTSFRQQDPPPVQQVQQVRPMQPIQPVQQYDPRPQGNQPLYGNQPQMRVPNGVTKFCEHCGSVIAKEAVICPACGCQVAAFQQVQQARSVIINNNNVNNIGGYITRCNAKDKWVAFFLCLFLGYLGAHRFYEGKIGTGFLYFFTGGMFGIGWIVDLIRIACSPNPYYV